MVSTFLEQDSHEDTFRPAFHSEAARFAFRIGQLVEQELLTRGAKKSQKFDSNLVTLEMLRSCLDESLIADARKQLNEPIEAYGRKAA